MQFQLIAILIAAAIAAQPRQVAITFDDLPDIGAESHPIEIQESLTTQLIAALAKEHVPATGFVNENKLDDDPRRIALIAQWIDAGNEIGNHTYSHVDLDQTTIDEYESDILRGETITRPLLASRGKTLQWFRHPYLDTGSTLATRDAIDAFLASHGYRVAPVTIDNSEWIYDLAYDRAPAWQRPIIRRSYIRYMRRRFEWVEAKSRLVFRRDIAHVLLLHASTLNADAFPQLASMMRRRGYRFVTLDEALRDRAYGTPDRWTGGGVGWVERWGVARGLAARNFENDPHVPRWIQRLTGKKDE